jgi:hypothetical protein
MEPKVGIEPTAYALPRVLLVRTNSAYPVLNSPAGRNRSKSYGRLSCMSNASCNADEGDLIRTDPDWSRRQATVVN